MSKALGLAADGTPGESADLMLQVLNSLGDPVYIKNDLLQFTFVNDALCSVQGRKREELLGKTLPEISNDERTRHIWNQEKSLIETGGEQREETEIPDAGETMHPVAIKRARITDGAGRNYIFCIMKAAPREDFVTAQPRGDSSQNPGTTITRKVIHDLNNSLNIIRGYSELLLDELATDDPIRKDLEAILQAGRHAADLTSKF